MCPHDPTPHLRPLRHPTFVRSVTFTPRHQSRSSPLRKVSPLIPGSVSRRFVTPHKSLHDHQVVPIILVFYTSSLSTFTLISRDFPNSMGYCSHPKIQHRDPRRSSQIRMFIVPDGSPVVEGWDGVDTDPRVLEKSLLLTGADIEV